MRQRLERWRVRARSLRAAGPRDQEARRPLARGTRCSPSDPRGEYQIKRLPAVFSIDGKVRIERKYQVTLKQLRHAHYARISK